MKKTNNIKYYILMTIMILVSCTSLAKQQNFDLKRSRLIIDTPKGWQIPKSFYGSDFSFLAPQSGKVRTIVAFEELPLDNYKISIKKNKENEQTYKNGRLKWAAKNKIKHLKFYPYQILNWNSLSNIHSIGQEYIRENIKLKEMTYFFKCSSRLINITSLIPSYDIRKREPEVHRLLNSITCITL